VPIASTNPPSTPIATKTFPAPPPILPRPPRRGRRPRAHRLLAGEAPSKREAAIVKRRISKVFGIKPSQASKKNILVRFGISKYFWCQHYLLYNNTKYGSG